MMRFAPASRQAGDEAQPEAQARCGARRAGRSIRAVLERAVPVARHDVHRQHVDAVPPRILHELGRGVEAHRLAVDQRRTERRRLVVLQPGRHVDQQREATPNAIPGSRTRRSPGSARRPAGERFRVAARAHAFDQARLELSSAPRRRHAAMDAAQLVGFARREARGDDRELHHLLLEDRHAERALEHALHVLARIGHGLQALAAAQVGMHHAALDGPGRTIATSITRS